MDGAAQGPIGVFDSGVGGLSVVQELQAALPHEDLLYLADTAHCPYGSRSPDEIAALALHGARWLHAQGAKALLVACNTASAAGLPELRAWAAGRWPVIGLVPAVKPAVAESRSKTIAVLTTAATWRGSLLQDVITQFAGPAGVTVLPAINPQLVLAVEAGAVHTPQTRQLLTDLLDPLLAAGADHLVLGCTHYPFLRPLLHDIYGSRLVILDSGAAVARHTGRVLEEWGLPHPGPRKGQLRVITSGDPVHVAPVVARLLGTTVAVQHADI